MTHNQGSSASADHRTKFQFDAFISYSHAADGHLAPALQKGLQNFAKPWYRLRSMRVFRDETGLAVTPELWTAIETALSRSRYFLLLASPTAAQSKWVAQEVQWWLTHRSAEQVLIILTDGDLAAIDAAFAPPRRRQPLAMR